MPLLARLYYQSHICTPGARILLDNRVAFANDTRLAYGWNLFQIPEKENSFHVLRVRAVATVEHKYSIQINGGKGGRQNHMPSIEFEDNLEKDGKYSGDESEKLDDKEMLRRNRISKANSGKTPWNKGRKHSAETKQRIKERTRIAMQNPKVKMKLANMGHAQRGETRVKIGVSVRTMWEKRREKQMVQEMCHFEWQNLIADAFRRGFNKEEELQWNSYKTLDEELEKEWLESMEQRKQMPRPKGHSRAPKPLEQRRKIAAAISAKWADPAYREKVQSALSKCHKSPARAERQPRRKPSDETQRQPKPPRTTTKKICIKPVKIVKGAESNRIKPRRRNMPMCKDPLASTKLEMIKNIKAQRDAAGTKKSQAIEQAKIMIAEAEKAAKALEEAALRSPLAQASLFETRNLIAEAIQSLQSIEIPQTDFNAKDQVKTNNMSVNSTLSAESSEGNIKDFDFGEFNLKKLVNGDVKSPSTSSSFNGLANGNGAFNIPGLNGHDKALVPNGAHFNFDKKDMNNKSVTVSKKWICGRLVEVVEGDTISIQ